MRETIHVPDTDPASSKVTGVGVGPEVIVLGVGVGPAFPVGVGVGVDPGKPAQVVLVGFWGLRQYFCTPVS